MYIPNAKAIEVVLALAGDPPYRFDSLTGKYVPVNETDEARYERIAAHVADYLRWEDYHAQRHMWGHRYPQETI